MTQSPARAGRSLHPTPSTLTTACALPTNSEATHIPHRPEKTTAGTGNTRSRLTSSLWTKALREGLPLNRRTTHHRRPAPCQPHQTPTKTWLKIPRARPKTRPQHWVGPPKTYPRTKNIQAIDIHHRPHPSIHPSIPPSQGKTLHHTHPAHGHTHHPDSKSPQHASRIINKTGTHTQCCWEGKTSWPELWRTARESRRRAVPVWRQVVLLVGARARLIQRHPVTIPRPKVLSHTFEEAGRGTSQSCRMMCLSCAQPHRLAMHANAATQEIVHNYTTRGCFQRSRDGPAHTTQRALTQPHTQPEPPEGVQPFGTNRQQRSRAP